MRLVTDRDTHNILWKFSTQERGRNESLTELPKKPIIRLLPQTFSIKDHLNCPSPQETFLKEKDTMKVENKMIGKDVPFQRTRRITGYLVGDLSRFNNAKRAEVKDRVKHTVKEK